MLPGSPRFRAEYEGADNLKLTERFDRALLLASELHRSQFRKGTAIPYMAHLMAVSTLVLENDGTEDEAIAGLLHDAVEDQGGAATLSRIRDDFGDGVAKIVAAVSDTDQTPKPPWHHRKQQYLLHLESASVPVLRVSAADKLHNARSLLVDFRVVGDELWERFSAPVAEQLWYYRSLADVFQRRIGGTLSSELSRTVGELELLVSPQ
jgi:(p)ppGpp synthase/HD superfamily hydrolase